MALDHPSLLESNQMRYVADSLKPVGSRLENEISYEINGCMLTWIANYCGSEFRFDCSNIIEIIDGYYKAEFYLDTKKLLDTTDALNSSCDTSDIVFTDYVSDETGKNISNSQTSKDYRKIDSISNASTEVDSLNEINSINTNGNEPEVAENKITKVENKEPDLEQTLPEKPNNQIEKPKDKVSTPQKKPVQAQVPPSQGFNLRSSRTNRNITSPNYFNKDDSRSFNCYSRIHSKPEITFTPEVKRRRNSKSEAGKKKPEFEVRRGERVRKVSIFQDCYIPASRNEWISEVFIGAHKENF
ncbi:hypothetical protein TpMuguga_02g00513 [Theileria parva strain Muguga]|uniref:Uncharacterized protein n=1 Tax=Theileria parva TaxID=5875 RepID=Q4N4X7_THEPA|nr:uncharacterized protein TpMuguga_02g00513 [Theileria parva strain Muguga]EAN32796.1 hypothetical protein TpMuguga_02g00513 [Theileria parva strain Muguga]|eukprot:XP_765079.1 hypothetical protein [Theileria parva strain Muguga]